MSTRFGSREYAFEKLVAELGSAILGLRFEVTSGGVPGQLDPGHARDQHRELDPGAHKRPSGPLRAPRLHEKR